MNRFPPLKKMFRNFHGSDAPACSRWPATPCVTGTEATAIAVAANIIASLQPVFIIALVFAGARGRRR
jgi:hypothetical protein